MVVMVLDGEPAQNPDTFFCRYHRHLTNFDGIIMRITFITLFTALAGLLHSSGAKEEKLLSELSTATKTEAHASLIQGSDASSLEKNENVGEGRALQGAPTDGVTEQDVRDLFQLWNNALLTQDPDTVARRYTTDAVLLPTVSDIPRDTHELIEDYFVHFLEGEPSGEIIESFVHIGYDWVMDVGIYEFTMATDGSVVRGRYSFVYAMEDGEWRIIHHHSSMMPEGMIAAAEGRGRALQETIPTSEEMHSDAATTNGITEQDVRDLFQLWNDALLTQDPDTVARRYTTDAVLLPTVSDIPRDTHELIEDYFVHFLEGEPGGEIIESFVHIGQDWVMDVGIYEFTMATDGSVVRGRYSFVYAMEDGEWRIIHHHSSMMPEGMIAAAEGSSGAPTDGVTEQDVRDLFQLWNDALLTQDPDTVARRYTSGAVLLPTVSDILRDTHELIEDYFVHFLAGEPSGEIIESFVHIGYDWVMDVGIYEFTMATDGSVVRGRYSFVYAMEDGEWRIIHHHSSMMPEGMIAAAEGRGRALQTSEEMPGSTAATNGVTEQDVRDLFQLWNDALLTQDPDTVARRYTTDAVLLPTVSDIPRDTHELIEDYFVHFLEGEPSGEIIESFVHIGQDWVMDVGIYEFTMATDGSVVRGRYSFVYAMEDGEWRIIHHHSSMMPVGMIAAAEASSAGAAAAEASIAGGLTAEEVLDLVSPATTSPNLPEQCRGVIPSMLGEFRFFGFRLEGVPAADMLNLQNWEEGMDSRAIGGLEWVPWQEDTYYLLAINSPAGLVRRVCSFDAKDNRTSVCTGMDFRDEAVTETLYVTETDEQCRAMSFSIITTKTFVVGETAISNMFVDKVMGVRTRFDYPMTPQDTQRFYDEGQARRRNI